MIPVSLRRARTASPSMPTPAPVPKPTFPLYLLPSLCIPFTRRRRSNVNLEFPQDGPSSCTSTSTSPSDTVPSLSTSPASPVSSTSNTPPSPTTPARRRRHGRRLSHARHDTLRCRGCATDVAFHAQIISKCFQGRYGRAYLVAPPSMLPTPTCPAIPTARPKHHRKRSRLQTDEDDDNNDNTDLEEEEEEEEEDEDEDDLDKDPNAPRELINTRLGHPEKRQLITGAHTVADVTCAVCRANIGWKYIDAREPGQRYKIGKYILETKRVVQVKGWEDLELGEEGGRQVYGGFDDYDDDDDVFGKGDGNWRAGEGGEEEDGDGGLVVFNLEDEDECEEMFAGVWDASVVARRRQSKAEGLTRWRHDASALL